MRKKVAIQGIKGSYHHGVAQAYFGDQIDVDECMSFQELVHSLERKKSTDAVMAIENSIAGSIIPNYAYIDEHNLTICGEYFQPIHHCLMALEGQEISDIKEVYSHPMALLQCKEFFRDQPHIKLVEDSDTADVAKRIQEQGLKGVAAVAGETAANIYQLNVLAKEIQTIKSNCTRFFILTAREDSGVDSKEINKASLKFLTDHKRGSLATVLNVMSDCGLNLTKIQSLPVINMPWKYSFFVDVTFSAYEDYQKAVSLLKIMALEFKILGEYKNQNG
ncbi:prephenate dehydratase [Aquimarina sp. AD1]|uniref:prephenate dehydratase n=1 Tax=Aquimarina sp. (strain AD1) TaxID=1714848 RepID=UPI000E4D126F|nr:prephenate dehydratase [Aquimarina sp. AD1]AXT58057.1 prephenate dehydratase [Aquimarina sp. AD1]RKN25613.1 prephenate dehydratase [Aquimarina sp. AD1]